MKKIYIICIIIFSIIILSLLTYKEDVIYDKFTKVKIDNNPFDFGTIGANDTIKHIFKLTNTTNTLFVIDKILPSCTCTVSKTDKKKCKNGESANVEVTFIPTKNQKNTINTVVFIQCNAEKGVLKLELTGKIK
ncbi:DUF1573 domain-containing protein [Flavobacterium gelidilacus]|jgi:hypothetical protein|uniref:DUF1573 domain-containing protein n=1 Tax=Flavobacterium gelidilacus TaxID=206041 RepID=UPI0003FEE2A5|nr:DUF1573 domain-containing protein [Flavobacterium gelidilacus]